MPVIRIEYDDKKLRKAEVLALSKAVQKIVSEVTRIQDVFVYANSAQIKVKVTPIEIFVQISENKVKNLDELMKEVKTRILNWKKKNAFPHKINLTIVPMKWKFEIGI